MARLGRADSPAQAAPISYPLTPNSSFLIPNSSRGDMYEALSRHRGAAQCGQVHAVQ
ncbi:hypothetical protein LAWASA_3536 [Lawsonibacter asaccharolyticus]|nr:hypothetical protein LAWASA_3536 [Lawsonibacter asaccharolyticus]